MIILYKILNNRLNGIISCIHFSAPLTTSAHDNNIIVVDLCLRINHVGGYFNACNAGSPQNSNQRVGSYRIGITC